MSYNSNNNSAHHSEIFQYGYSTQANTYHYMPDGNSLNGDDSNFWSSSPRSDSPSPTSNMQNSLIGSYPYFTGTSRVAIQEQRHSHYRNTYPSNVAVTDETSHVQVPYVRVVKRRTTANKKERRRTQSINNAYADLRDCIPNVPPDTKLSKIKTLRLATSYINYLVKALESDDPAGSFTAELGSMSRKSANNNVQINECSTEQVSAKGDPLEDMNKTRKSKGRTGWPQHVWALELEQEQAL